MRGDRLVHLLIIAKVSLEQRFHILYSPTWNHLKYFFFLFFFKRFSVVFLCFVFHCIHVGVFSLPLVSSSPIHPHIISATRYERKTNENDDDRMMSFCLPAQFPFSSFYSIWICLCQRPGKKRKKQCRDFRYSRLNEWSVIYLKRV